MKNLNHEVNQSFYSFLCESAYSYIFYSIFMKTLQILSRGGR